MVNYHYRKYEGAPHSEKKRHPAESPSKLSPRATKKHTKKVSVANLYRLYPGKRQYWWTGGGEGGYVSPHLGVPLGSWSLEHAAEHVIKRFKANLLRDAGSGLFWVEIQANHKQVSPEFSSYYCCLNWLLFEGLKRGWLYVESFWTREYTWRGKHHPSRKQFNLRRR